MRLKATRQRVDFLKRHCTLFMRIICAAEIPPYGAAESFNGEYEVKENRSKGLVYTHV